MNEITEPMPIPERPDAGWGIFNPDPEINIETRELLWRISQLPRGQQEAILVRAIPRKVALYEDEYDHPPSRSDMVTFTTDISNAFFDMLGHA